MTSQIFKNSELIKNIPLEFLGFHGPITVLVFFNEFILFAGQGPYIKIYDVMQGFLIYAARIFKKNQIHGIVYAKRNKLVIWGGKDFCIVNLDDLFNNTDFDVCVVSEWIFDVKPSFDKSYIWLTTSRNKVYVYDIQTKSCIQVFSCNENPLLYSSSLYIHYNGSVTVASATIFNEIQIWHISPYEFFNKKNILIHVAHRLKEHEGAAFKVNFSNDGKLLCSCSDDRSIKVWDLNTGKCKATGWGHNSRVWDVKFIDNDNSRLISVSEDTTARVWKMIHKSKLKQNSVYSGHEGKNVWSVSVFKNIFATGGSDGKIRLWEINDKVKIQHHITADDIKNAINSLPNILYDTFRSYVLINSFQILIVSVFGNVLIFNIKTKKFNYLFYDSDLSSFSKVSLWSKTNFVNISDKFGNIYILDIKNNLSVKLYFNTLLLILSRSQNIIYLMKKYNLYFLYFIMSNFIYEKNDIISIVPMELTAAVISFEASLVFLGFRTGFLSIHRLEDFGKGLPSVYIIKDLYKENALHTIILHPYENNLLNKKLEITTIGHNWMYYILELTFNSHNNTIQIEKKHHEKCNKHGVEGGFYLKGDLILYGFKKLRFFIWNQSKDFDIFSTICGGQHRHWSIYFSYSKKIEKNSTFVFTRSNSIITCHFSLLSPFQSFQKIILQEGRHGREIRTMAFHPILYQKNTLLFLTGAEDTTVRLSKLYITKYSEIINIYRVKQHTAGVEKVSWSKNGIFFFSCGGAEEFITWKFSIKSLNQIRIIDHAVCPVINNGRNVRIIDFCIVELSNKNNYLIIMACSDSSIRVWLFQSKKSKYNLISNEKYSTRCLLNVICISEKSYCYLLVASTDGFITIWNISNYVKSLDINIIQNNFFPPPIWKNQLHQSSIKSMILTHIKDEKYLLVTGGDDNKINLTEIIIKLDSDSYKISCNIIMNKLNAHDSSITGLVFSRSGLLISIATDQKLKIWKVSSSQLIFLSEFYTYVADPSGISIAKILDREILVIYGIGLEIFSFNTLIST
ncbi:uncharacterized protein T551_03652 [Pneumocystis jirovecii RU7]|uniref:Anaphase-promoting complex subunit 4 WD40 domain-containing protein n=1 Tax=Pneumocystis jirovecii (strain RU7) TaxID=1408657 RepID=A0A0W4ZBJ5_PNEJ7|nr:uncharacterized protein T551_03652 [Pneumocystis jirovecii RU7]KTW25816.1 hypothetical protein T551_03652 [Pneumocystis jirovecii RU7]